MTRSTPRTPTAPMLLAAIFIGCSGVEGDTAPLVDTGEPMAVDLPFEITTSAFDDGDAIPLRYECGGILQGPGDNVSPDLSWTPGPEGTRSYAIVMDDVDSGVVHWVIYDIPKSALSLPENVPAGYALDDPDGALQAELQGSGYHGYFGPCSEFSTNTYRWTVHAMSGPTVSGASQQTSEYEMVPLIEAESLGSAEITGES